MSGNRQRPPRQSDVARLAGVSQSAVSRVIGGDADAGRIPEATRRRIHDAVRQLGYVPNLSARNLRNKRNNLLGVHTFERVFPHATESFYFQFLLGIEERAEEVGYDLVLFTSTGVGGGPRQVYRDGVNRLSIADASVLLGFATDKADLARLWHDGYTFVHIGRRDIPGADIPCIIPDYCGVTAEVVDALYSLGHRRIGYVRESIDIEPSIDRRLGYVEAVKRLGLQDRSRGGHREIGISDAWLNKIIHDDVTAVVTESKRLADILVHGLVERGLRVPDDISVAVLEDSEPGDTLAWHSLHIPRKDIGRRAVDVLVNLLEDPDQSSTSHLVTCTIVPGNTVAAPRSARR